MTQTLLFDPATVDRRTLPNGLTAIVRVDRSAAVVAIVTWLEVGYFDEPDALAGISHVLEHLFFKGTPSRGPGRIAQDTKAAGGYLNASTIYDHTSYYTVLPSRALAEGLAIQSDALLNSVIDAGELERELQVIIQEARRKLDNPDAVAQECLYELMFDRHRMRRWRIGTEAFLRTLTRDTLWTWYRDMYRGPRAMVVVAGDVDADQAHRLIEQHYHALAGGAAEFERGPTEPERTTFRLREQSGDIRRARLGIGWHTPGALHDDTVVLDLLSVVLGQGRASRLYRNLRESGLVSAISSHNYTPPELGVFEITAELDSNDALPALEAMAGTVRALSERIDEHEVERAKNVVEARAIRGLESMEGQARYLAEWQALGDWQLGSRVLERLGRVSAAELRDCAGRYLTIDRAAVFLYRPTSHPPLGWTADRLQERLVQSATRPGPAPAGPAVKRAASNRRPARERVEDEVHFYSIDGARIVIKPRRVTPLVSIALATRGGASLEQPNRAGYAALAGRTSIKGTSSRSALQLALAAEALGSSVQPGVTADLLDWGMTVPSRHFGAALELLLDPALDPAFPEDEVETEKKVILSDLQQLRDDMMRYPLRLFLSAAFAGHPYGPAIERSEAAIAEATAESLREWHHAAVLSNQRTVLIVGDVDADAAVRSVARLLDGTNGVEPVLPTPVWPAQRIEVSDSRQKAQTAVLLGFPGVDHRHPDAIVLQLLANAVAGLGGRLFEELRSRRSLAYTVTAYPIARALGGAFVAYIATAPEREDEARRGLLQELGRLSEQRLTEEEVERARRYTIGTWQIRAQTNAAQLGLLGHALLIGRGLEELRDFEERVLAVTPQQILDVAARYFDETRCVEAIVRGTGNAR